MTLLTIQYARGAAKAMDSVPRIHALNVYLAVVEPVMEIISLNVSAALMVLN